MKHPGISKQKIPTAQQLLAMTKLVNPIMANHHIFDGVKLRKPRVKESKPRKAYNREEDRLRPIIIKELRRYGFLVSRIENSICGKNNSSIPDLWLFHIEYCWSGWAEIKIPKGVLSKGQKQFDMRCSFCGISYNILRSEEDVVGLYKAIKPV